MHEFLRLAAIAAGVIASTTCAWAQDSGIGQHEYRSNCATCHGAAGKGDGPMADVINLAMPDLTALSKNNGGIFPAERLREVIDGRAEVAAHGSRDMPAWGDAYNAQAGSAGLLGYYHEGDVDAFVKGRILALVDYIATLQAQ